MGGDSVLVAQIPPNQGPKEIQMDIVMYGADWCADCRRSKRLLDEREVAYSYVDLEQAPAAIEEVLERNDGRRVIPTIVFADGSHLSEPTDSQLSSKLDEGGLPH
jgi:glutaredoxin